MVQDTVENFRTMNSLLNTESLTDRTITIARVVRASCARALKQQLEGVASRHRVEDCVMW